VLGSVLNVKRIVCLSSFHHPSFSLFLTFSFFVASIRSTVRKCFDCNVIVHEKCLDRFVEKCATTTPPHFKPTRTPILEYPAESKIQLGRSRGASVSEQTTQNNDAPSPKFSNLSPRRVSSKSPTNPEKTGSKISISTGSESIKNESSTQEEEISSQMNPHLLQFLDSQQIQKPKFHVLRKSVCY
jgi:hypothetical protein